MDETTLGIVYFVSIVISIVTLICFFYLCYNVSKIKNSLTDDFKEYQIQKQLGDNDKAFYYLKRAFITTKLKGISALDEKLEMYYENFLNLGSGIPDYDEFKKIKNTYRKPS